MNKVQAVMAVLLMILTGCGAGFQPVPTSGDSIGLPVVATSPVSRPDNIQVIKTIPPRPFSDDKFNMITPPRGVSLAVLRANGFKDPTGVLGPLERPGWYEKSRAESREFSEDPVKAKAKRDAEFALKASARHTSAVEEYDILANAAHDPQGTLNNGWVFDLYSYPVGTKLPQSYEVNATGAGEIWIQASNYTHHKWGWQTPVPTDGTTVSATLISGQLATQKKVDRPYTPFDLTTGVGVAWVAVIHEVTATPTKLTVKLVETGDPPYEVANPWSPEETYWGLESGKTTSGLGDNQRLAMGFETHYDANDIMGSDNRYIATQSINGGAALITGDADAGTGFYSVDADNDPIIGSPDAGDEIEGTLYAINNNAQSGGDEQYSPAQTVPICAPTTLSASVDVDSHVVLTWDAGCGTTSAADGKMQYQLFRVGEATPFATVDGVEDQTEYTYTDLTPVTNKPTSYKVKVVNTVTDNVSDPSAAVTVAICDPVTTISFDGSTSGSSTVPVYQANDLPAFFYVDSATSTLRCAWSNTSTPANSDDFTIGDVTTQASQNTITGIAALVYSDDDHLLVVWRNAVLGLCAAVSTMSQPTSPTDWVETVIDPLSTSGTLVAAAWINGKPAVACNLGGNIRFAYSAEERPDADSDWVADDAIGSGAITLNGLALVDFQGVPAIATLLPDSNKRVDFQLAATATPTYSDWGSWHTVMALANGGTSLGMVSGGTQVNMAIGTSTGSCIFATATNPTETADWSFYQLGSSGSSLGTCRLGLVNGSPTVALSSSADQTLVFSTASAPLVSDWAETSSLGTTVGDSNTAGFAIGTDYLAVSDHTTGSTVLRYIQYAH